MTIRSMCKSIVSSTFKKITELLEGTFVKNIPGIGKLHSYLFWHLWPRERIMEIQGSKMYLNPDDLPRRFKETCKIYIRFGIWEEYTTEMLKKVATEGNIVVDLGANIGYFTLLTSRLVGNRGKVYAFEPEPVNYSLLVKNVEINGYENIIPVQKAVSNTAGTTKLFIDNEKSYAHTIGKYYDKKGFVEIESVTLDDYFKEKEHTIDIIKIDIVGAELAALMGMVRIIKQNPNLKVFLEFNPSLINYMGHTADELAHALFEDWHFSAMVIDDYPRNKKLPRVNSVNEFMDFCKGDRFYHLLLEKTTGRR